jgi:transposase InsO family protein
MAKKEKKVKRPVRLDALLKGIWEDPGNIAGFSSAYNLYRAAKEKNPNITVQLVENWLAGKPAYSLHRRIVRTFKRRKVLCRGLNYQWQADLMEVQEIAKENKNFRYLLAVIDCFSRYAYVLPLKDKKAETTARAFESLISPTNKPINLQTDQGKEFTGAPFKTMCAKYNINHFHTYQDVKAQIVERFNKTFKMRMVKYFRTNQTLNYVKVLSVFVDTYNRTPHSSIGVSPRDVTKRNEKQIHKFQYGKYLAETMATPRFKVNDSVRLSSFRKTFKRGYEKKFTEEIFAISDIYPTNPRTYAVRDKDNEILEGAVYEQELIKVRDVVDT